MATKKTKLFEPVIIRGSHSTRTQWPDGRVEFETHWDELVRDVNEAIREYEADKTKTNSKQVKKAVEAVVKQIKAEKPAKKTVAKKTTEKAAKPNTKSTAKKATTTTSRPKKTK